MASDSFVVGLDLPTGAEAYIADASVPHWRSKSYKRGDESLVCLHCYHGIDAKAGTRIPLVVKHRDGGRVRPHFSHPPNMAPTGGHGAETLWHAEGKHVMAHWARQLPGVASAEPERYTPDRHRRADVDIRLANGQRVALELQYRLLHDDDWLARHLDYARAGITDVWLWHPQISTPWVLARNHTPLWFLELPRRKIGTLSGLPHRKPFDWCEKDNLRPYAEHWPPCVGDETSYRVWDIGELSIDAGGLVPPPAFLAKLSADLAAAQQEAVDAREQANRRAEQLVPRQRAAEPVAASSLIEPPALPPSDNPKHARPAEATRNVMVPRKPVPRCDLCGIKLAEIWWESGRHLDCEQQLHLRKQRQRRDSRPWRP